MEEYLSEFHRLLDYAEAESYLPHTGPDLEKAAKLALDHNDVANALMARYLYVFAVAPIEPEKALVAFSWCVAHRDVADEALPFGSLAQLYGIAIGILRSYPNYTLEQIEATFRQMEMLYQELGLSKRDVLHQRIYLDLSLGRRDDAEVAYKAWLDSEKDAFSCPVCDLGTRIIYRLHREDFSGGLALARPLLEGEIHCEHGQPLLTFAASILPLLREERFEEARVSFNATRQMLGELSYAGIWAAGRLLSYLSLLGQTGEAAKLLNEHASVALKRGTPADRFGYLLACRMLATRLEENHLKPADIAPYFELDDDAGADQLLAKIQGEIDELASAFDARNGNAEYTRIVNLFETVYQQITLNLPV